MICTSCRTTLQLFTEGEQGTVKFINHLPDVQKHLKNLQQYRILAVGPHQGLLQQLISRFKYGKKTWLANELSSLLLMHVHSAYQNKSLPQAIVPVPLHFLKYMLRGFNQTDLLAYHLSQKIGIPLQLDLVSKKAWQKPQAGKTGKQRRSMDKTLFKIEQTEKLAQLSHIAIIDDVITTGTTMKMLCRELHKIHPRLTIDLWCLSVSLPHR